MTTDGIESDKLEAMLLIHLFPAAKAHEAFDLLINERSRIARPRVPEVTGP